MKRFLLLLPCFLFASGSLIAEEIYCHAASSLTEALTQLGNQFMNQTNQKIIFNFGASSFVARQLAEGAPADLFLSADEEKMNQLEAKGLLLEKTRTQLLSNTLVFVARKEAGVKLESPKDLRTMKGRIAIAEYQSVPAGIYARKYLVQVGIWEDLQERLIPVQNVRAALAAVEAGNVEIGIVYKTDAKISRLVSVIYEVQPKEGLEIRYSVAMLKKARNPSKAREFYEYLLSKDAAKVFQEYGFIPLQKR